MIKDVKSYFQTVASRISNAFLMESFETEDELEFWALSAEYLSQKEPPSFIDITSWIDRLYKAPVHFIYKMAKDDKLILFKRHIITDNIIRDIDEELEEIAPKQRSGLISKLEEQLENLELKIFLNEDFKSIGVSAFSIGQCEHIPLYKDGNFWGIYCLGPYVQSPETMIPKFSIISRILTLWLTDLEDKEKENQLDQDHTVVKKIEGFGSGELNIEEISDLLIRYLVENTSAVFGSIVTQQGGKIDVLASYNDSELSEKPLLNLTESELFDKTGDSFTLSKKALETINQSGFGSHQLIPIAGNAYLMLLYKDSSVQDLSSAEDDLQYIIGTQEALLTYQKQSEQMSDRLIESYYRMLRILENKRDKTAWHTPRMVAFTDEFSDLFGLDELEKANLLLTAKLHDIGYVGALHINKKMTVSAEIEHPLIGEMMVQQLPISREVKDGIRTHHEWVNGSGTPRQLKEEEIPWIGKIISVFEFIVDFIENHHKDKSKTDEEWMEKLIEELIDRADKQFDMVLVPTFVELLRSLGWKKCCELGVE